MTIAPFQIPPGLERNNTPFSTPDRWWDMNQIRFISDSMLPIGGWQRISGTPLDSPARTIRVWRDNTATRATLIGTDDKLYVDSSGAYVDITPVGLAGPGEVLPASGGFGVGPFGAEEFGTARTTPSPIASPYGYWSIDNYGEDAVVMNNSDGRLFYYDQTSPTSAPVLNADAPTGNAAVVVTGERHVLLIGANGDPRQIRWCSREDPTDWDVASLTNSAGFLNLKTRSPLLKGYTVASGTVMVGGDPLPSILPASISSNAICHRFLETSSRSISSWPAVPVRSASS